MMRRIRHLAVLLTPVFAVVLSLSTALAQEPEAGDDAVAEDLELLSGAIIETNPDADALLAQAQQYMRDGQHRDAVLLLQHTVENYGDAMVNLGDGRYRPARLAAESILADADDNTLTLYRLQVDGTARQRLGGPASECRDIKALRSVASEMFYSSVGDEAAYALACILLDQGEPAEAAYLLDRVMAHPDRDIDRGALQERLAMAAAQIGDVQRALSLIESLDTTTSRVDRTRVAIRTQLERHASLGAQYHWTTPHGNDARKGVMPAVNIGTGSMPGVPAWQYVMPMRGREFGGTLPNSRVRMTNVRPQSRTQLVRRWLDHDWMPTSHLVFNSESAFYKSGSTLVALDVNTGNVQWIKRRNADLPKASDLRYYATNTITQSRLTTPEETLLFGDRISPSISLIDDKLFHIIGSSPYRAYNRRITARGFVVAGNWISTQGRDELLAIDPATGNTLWQADLSTKPETETSNNDGDRFFLATPVRVGDRLFVPVNENNELVIYSLNPNTGQRIDRQFVCSSPMGFSPPWAVINLTVDGPVIYGSGGNGLVFAFDTAVDSFRWVSYYPRTAPVNLSRALRAPHQGVWQAGEQSFTDNTVFSSGRFIVAAPADSPHLVVFDRLSGKRLRTIPAEADPTRHAGNHVIGLADGRVYLGDPQRVTCYALETGRLLWEAPTPGATGRGAITEDQILMPVGRTVISIDRKSGKRLARIATTENIDEPLGNLYSDGRRLYVAGMGSLVALTNGRGELERLTAQVDTGDAASLQARADLLSKMGLGDESLQDLRRLQTGQLDPASQRKAKRLYIETLLKAAQPGNPMSDPLLIEAESLIDDALGAERFALARAAHDAMANRPRDAIERYRAIAMRDTEGLVPLVSDGDESLARPAAAAIPEIRKLTQLHGGELITILQAGGQAELTRAERVQDLHERFNAFCHIARVHAPAPVALRAIRGAIELSDQPHVRRFALVEAALFDLMRSGDASFELASGIALMRAYHDRGWPQDADAVAAMLLERHADHASDIAPAIETIRQLRVSLQEENQRDGRTLTQGPLATIWFRQQGGAQLMQTLSGETTAVQSLRDNALIYVPRLNRITLREPTTQKSLWSLELPSDNLDVGSVVRGAKVHRGGVWRHTMMLRTGHTLYALDLAEGGRLWSHVDDTPTHTLNPYWNLPATDIRTYDIGDGVYVERYWDDQSSTDVLVARDTLDGRVLWQRTFNQHTVGGVWVRSGWVCVIVDDGKAMWLCDPWSGRVRRQINLIDYHPGTQMVWTRRGPIYKDGRSVRFVPIDGQSQSAWLTHGPARRLYALNDDHVVVLWQDGGLSLVDLRLGREPWYLQPDNSNRFIHSAGLDPDGNLYLSSFLSGNRPSVRVVDIKTGQTLKTLDSQRPALFPIDARYFAKMGPVLPVLERVGNNPRYATIRWHDLDQGKSIEAPKLHVPASHGYLEQVRGIPEVRGGVLLIHLDQGLLALGPANHAPANPARSGLFPALPPDAAAPNASRTQIRTNNGTIIIQGEVNGQPIRLTPEQIKKLQQDQGNAPIQIQPQEDPVNPE